MTLKEIVLGHFSVISDRKPQPNWQTKKEFSGSHVAKEVQVKRGLIQGLKWYHGDIVSIPLFVGAVFSGPASFLDRLSLWVGR